MAIFLGARFTLPSCTGEDECCSQAATAGSGGKPSGSPRWGGFFESLRFKSVCSGNLHPLKKFSHVWVKYKQLEERQISLPFPEGSCFFSLCPPSSKLKIRVSGNQIGSRKILFSKMNQSQNSRDLFSFLKIFLFVF